MVDTTLKVQISGFEHDVGKIPGKEDLELGEEYISRNQDIYQPSFDGRFSHVHGLYTAAFLEEFADVLPRQFNEPGWGEGDSFINLAACHHKPETPMQWIITVADRISAGWDRASFDTKHDAKIAVKEYQKTRLFSLFERLNPDEETSKPENKAEYAYELKPLSPETIFPKKLETIKPLSTDQARSEYSELFKQFCSQLGNLAHRKENLELWFEHFDSLFLIYFSSVPAARAGEIIPDVSLYDHSKGVAALSGALYLYHRATNTLTEEAVRDLNLKKFLLIEGDFFGIQDFIFKTSGDLRKLRSKLLRGRSFAVSLFSELAADMICREIGLSFASVVLNAAGKFTIIAPNVDQSQKAVEKVEKEVNQWLMKFTYGQNTFGLATCEASGAEFLEGGFVKLKSKLQAKMELKKLNRIDLGVSGGLVADYLDSFNNELEPALCPLCGRRPSKPNASTDDLLGDIPSACEICRDHVYFGTNLVKKPRVAIYDSLTTSFDRKNGLLQPIFGRYQVSFVEKGNLLPQQAANGSLLRFWDIDPDLGQQSKREITTKFINGYVPVFTEEDKYRDQYLAGEKSESHTTEKIDQIDTDSPKTFGHIADMALNPVGSKNEIFKGVSALGALKADVDNLGALMAFGLPEKELTLSRLATLSRQINFYFSIYLPHTLRSTPALNDVYTVFAGGDDLFVIGPWNRTIDLARELSTSFRDYVCHNPKITFSAGYMIQKPNAPVDKIAEQVEHALAQSKDLGRNRLTIFAQPITWSNFAETDRIKKTIADWYENQWINNAMLYRLNGLIDMAEKESHLGDGIVAMSDMDCVKWRSYLAYTCERNVAKVVSGDKRKAIVQEVHQEIAFWLTNYGARLRIPLWEILYNMR